MELLYIKLILVSLIHTVLLYLLLRCKYHKKIKTLNIEQIIIFISVLFLLIFYLVNEYLYNDNKYTLYIIHAAFLTIWYTELAFYLEKYFWRDFLQNQLPFSINLLLSFILMINAGYFTLMFIIRIRETENFY